MEWLFWLKKLITKLVLPPFNLLLLGVLGLLLLKRWPRVGRACAWTSLLLILFFSTPAISHWLMRSLIVAPPFDVETAKSAQAIVVLGGGLRLNTAEYGDTLAAYSLDRVRYAATVARQTQLPVLTTGGPVIGDTPEATVMAQVLEREFNVPVRWIEDRALDTEDNLHYTAAMLKPERVETVILVTHDFHMLRALAHCEAAGLECIPAPVSFQGRSRTQAPWMYHLPDAQALWVSSMALHEVLGYVALKVF